MTCNSECYNKMMDKLKGPTNNNSLASHRIYDSQIARSRCIEPDNSCDIGNDTSKKTASMGPVGAPYFSRSKQLSSYDTVEGFNCNFNKRTMLKWLIIGLIVYLLISMITDAQRKPIIIPISLMDQAGGAFTEVDLLSGLFD